MSGRCRNSTCRPCPPLVCSEGGHRLRCRVGAARAVLSPSSRPHHATHTPYFPAPALHRIRLQGLCSSPTPRRPATTTLRRTIDDSQQRCADRGETHRDTPSRVSSLGPSAVSCAEMHLRCGRATRSEASRWRLPRRAARSRLQAPIKGISSFIETLRECRCSVVGIDLPCDLRIQLFTSARAQETGEVGIPTTTSKYSCTYIAYRHGMDVWSSIWSEI